MVVASSISNSLRLLPSSLASFLHYHRSPHSCRFRRPSSITFPLSPIHSISANGVGAGGVESQLPAADGEPQVIFIGTGTSEGIPRVSCLTNPSNKCPVCSKAAQPGDKNRRLNTSILIRHPNSSPTGGTHNILIDAGKFFYHSALRWFPEFGIRNIDAVIITHSHADAIGGLDDLRDWTNNVQPHIPIYVAKRDFEVLSPVHAF